METEGKKRIIVALDVDSVYKAKMLVTQLTPHVGYFKIGLELIYSMLASLLTAKDEEEAVHTLNEIRELFDAIKDQTFLDTKLDDIPNTVAGATKAIARIGTKIFNVHASAGPEAVKQAVANKGDAVVLGVTVLTSHNEESCVSTFGDKPGPKVIQFAKMLAEVGANGIVCSPQELRLLAQHPELAKLKKVVPGVRPEWAAVGDQKRVMTPAEAILAGADFLVIGRPITQPPKEIGGPVEAAQKIAEEIKKALIERPLIEHNAIWTFRGSPGEPHALLASGKHSDGYINLNAVLQSPALCETFAEQLATKLRAQGITKETVDVVVSSSYAAIVFGYAVAKQLGVDFIFTEKLENQQIFGERFVLAPGARILQVEELITTLKTAKGVKDAVLNNNPEAKFVQLDGKTVVATVIHRPDKLPITYEDYTVVALIEKEIHAWDPDGCPLCKNGSEPLKPKQNWQRFLQS
jgi:orotidine-5'-phosphate decarboxylase